MRFWLWLYTWATSTDEKVAYAPAEEVQKHGRHIAVIRYTILRELEGEYGRDREYPSEQWMNRRLKERQVDWRVRDKGEYWETFSPKDPWNRPKLADGTPDEEESSLQKWKPRSTIR